MLDTHIRLPDDVQKAVWALSKEDERAFNKEIVALLREAVIRRREATKKPPG